jgi:transcriptional regulator with XRE-family HTH domain
MRRPVVEYNRIRIILYEQSKSGKWLAKELHYSEGMISLWCSNRKQPPIKTLFKIAHVLGVDVGDLLIPLNQTINAEKLEADKS